MAWSATSRNGLASRKHFASAEESYMNGLYEHLDWIKSKVTVMSTIHECQPIGVKRISEKCGISERRTCRILDELKDDSVVKTTSKGEALIGDYNKYAIGR
jgi:predicted transcriptional regulator